MFGFLGILVATLLEPGAWEAIRTSGGRFWVIEGVGATIVLIIWVTTWRTHRLFAHQSHLEARRGKQRRRIEFSDVQGVERPFYVYHDVTFGTLELQLRNGDSIYFMPTPGAEGYLRARAGLPPVGS